MKPILLVMDPLYLAGNSEDGAWILGECCKREAIELIVTRNLKLYTAQMIQEHIILFWSYEGLRKSIQIKRTTPEAKVFVCTGWEGLRGKIEGVKIIRKPICFVDLIQALQQD